MTEPATGSTAESTAGITASTARLGRATGVMALGTIASRGTGFLRTIAITAAIGTRSVGDAYNVANTTPNIIYDLLLGGVLTSVLVPVLVRANREDEDGGDRFASSLLTVVGLGLAVFTVLGILIAPLIARIYVANPAEVPLTTTFMRWFLPQIVFYGIGATIGAILNIRGRFAAPMVTPVLNNLVVIAVAVIFIFLPGPQPPTIAGMTTTQIWVLGAGTTLGVVVMTLALLPSLRASGFRYRPRLDLRHPGLRQAMRLGSWVLVYVGASQVSYFVVTRLATGPVAFTTYTNAFQLFQLPYAIVAVSLITALLPRMSAHAADDRLDLVRSDLSLGLRMSAVVLVPASLGLLVLARPVAISLFAHHSTSVADAIRIGNALAAFALAVVPFSAFQLQLRAFYSMADSRTPAFVMCGVSGVNIVTALALANALPARDRAVALALSFALSYAVGAAICFRLLRRRLNGVEGRRITRTVVRSTVPGVIAAGIAYAISTAVRSAVGPGVEGSLLGALTGALVGGAFYTAAAWRMTEELRGVASLMGGRFRGR
jgi:putative peptidoglycan lipid II flippase